MSRDDDFHQFLGAMALGADGSSRKTASPSLLSPLPAGPPPTGETFFKKKNRHVKTSSQPIKIDISELRKEYSKAAGQPRQASDEILESDKSMKSIHTDDGGEEGKKKSSVGMSFAKRFPKMSLVRGISSASAATEKSSLSSPRPRSPSKDSTVGGLMRIGNRSAIVSKLGFGKLNKRESEDRGNLTDSEEGITGSPYFTPSSAIGHSHLPPIVSSSLQLPPTAPQLSYSASMPPGAISGMRRSSAPNSNLGPDQQFEGNTLQPLTDNDGISWDKRSSAAKGRLPGLDVSQEKNLFATNDLSPVLLQEKNPSASMLQHSSNSDAFTPSMTRTEQELQRWREDHAALELNMARNVKGSLVLSKTVGGKVKRPSGGLDDTGGARDEALRVAALTLQANNDARLRELSRKVAAFEERATTISHHANRIREDLLTECRALVEHADSIDASFNAEREAFKQKEISYRTTNTKSESELRSLNEKISNVLVLKEKAFRDMMSDAETRLRKIATGREGSTESGWLVDFMDYTAHTIMELILLGGGTILSLIYSLVMAIRSLNPCIRSSRVPATKVKKSNSNPSRSKANTTAGN